MVAPPSPPYLGPAPHAGARTNKPIRRIVIHCTAGAEPGVSGAARDTVKYTKTSGVVSSYHYVADAKESIQLVYDSVVAYHCGTNDHSIGYELCCSLAGQGEGHWKRPDHQAMLKLAADDVARLCLAYEVPMTRVGVIELKAGRQGITGHVDMRDAFGNTTHWDPGPYFPWVDFISMVRAAADRLTMPDPPPKPTPTPTVKPAAPTAPPHDPFTIAVLPGRFDAPLQAWLDRHSEARTKQAQVVTLTEGTDTNLVELLTTALKRVGWDSYHDPARGPANIIHTWDSARFERVGDPWKVQLDTTDVWTKTGIKRAQTWSVGVALRDKEADATILLVGAHLPLENTARRRKAKAEALATLHDEAFDAGRRQFPDAVRMFACDWNRPARKQATRDWFKATWPGLTAAWASRRARGQGPDWVAAGGRLVHLESKVLPRTKGDPLDHTTKVSRWGWR